MRVAALCATSEEILSHESPAYAVSAASPSPTNRPETQKLQRLAAELDHTHPGAAGSLREGMEETLTVTRLAIKGKLKRTLESTNPCESTIDTVRTTQRNVKHWSSGEMGLRWTAAGMLEAEKQYRKVIGFKDLAKLAIAIERDLDRRRQLITHIRPEEPTTPVTV